MWPRLFIFYTITALAILFLLLTKGEHTEVWEVERAEVDGIVNRSLNTLPVVFGSISVKDSTRSVDRPPSTPTMKGATGVPFKHVNSGLDATSFNGTPVSLTNALVTLMASIIALLTALI